MNSKIKKKDLKLDKLIPYKSFLREGILFFLVSVIIVIIHKRILDNVFGFNLLVTVIPYSIICFFGLGNLIRWLNLITSTEVRVFLYASSWRKQIKTLPTLLLLVFLNLGQLLFLFNFWLSFLRRI